MFTRIIFAPGLVWPSSRSHIKKYVSIFLFPFLFTSTNTLFSLTVWFAAGKERSAPKISSLLAHTRSPSCIHYSYSTSCQTSRTNHPRRPFLVLRHPCPRLIIGGPVPVYPVCPTQRDAIWARVRKNLREKRQESGG